MSRLRVINLALPKTGTTTLTDALRAAGLTVADWKNKARSKQPERYSTDARGQGDL